MVGGAVVAAAGFFLQAAVLFAGLVQFLLRQTVTGASGLAQQFVADTLIAGAAVGG